MMVGLQMLTDGGAQTLFQKAILESSAYPPAVQLMTVAEQDSYTETVAGRVGCKSADATAMLTCLRAKDAAALVAAGGNMDWRPVVDKSFLVDLPHRLVEANKVSKIPIVLGSNTDDGMYSTFTSPVPRFTEEESRTFDELYPSSAFPFEWARWAEVNEDLVLVCPNEKLAETLAPQVKTYRYRFNAASLIAATRLSVPLAAHGGEIPYVFNDTANFATNPTTDANFATDGPTQMLVGAVQRYWTNFAKYGSPNAPNKTECRYEDVSFSPSPSPSLVWPQYGAARKEQLVLQKNLVVESNGANMPQHTVRCAFWQTVGERLASAGAYVRAPTPTTAL